MRRAALPCRRHRRGLLLVPCVAGLLAAFVVTPSPAAQRTTPSQQPKLWALGVSAGKVPSVKVAKLQWLRRRGIQALVVNASALSPKRLAKLTDRAAHSGMLVIAARGSLRPGACPGSSSTLRTCAVIAQTPRKAVRLTRLNSFDYVVYYVHDLRQVNYLRGVKATHTQLLAIVPPALVRTDTNRWKSVAATASADSALNLTIRTAPAASRPVMGLIDLLKRWRPRLVPPRKSPAPAPPPVTNAATTPVTTDPPPTPTTPPPTTTNPPTTTTPPPTTTTPPPTTTTPPPTTTTPPPTTTTPPPTTTTPPPTTTTPPPTTTTPPPTTTTPPPTTTTPPPTTTTGDTQPPSAPGGLAVTGATQTSVTINWNASSDNIGVSGYDLLRNGSSAGTTSATTGTFASLTCGTSYTFGVDAFDATGNKSTASTIVASTSACPDTQPPTSPNGVLVTGSTLTSISITWNASFDNVSVAGYDLYRGSTLDGTSTAFTVYTFSGLSCGTSYSLSVDAYDPSGNKSAKSSVASSTSPCPDTTAPSAPASLTSTASTTTSVSISWTASTDNVSVTAYRAFLNGTQAGTTSSTNYQFTGLTCGTTYSLGVAASDGAGNVSSTTSINTATAPCATGSPSPSANVYVSPSGNDSTCARADSSKPCNSFDRAYKIANCGDLVSVAGGSYTGQTVGYGSSQAGCSSPITFAPADGTTVAINGDLEFDGARHIAVVSPSQTNFTVSGDLAAIPNSPSQEPTDISVSGVNFGGRYYFEGLQGGDIAHNDFGPANNDEPMFWYNDRNGQPAVSNGVTFEHNTVHDFTSTGGSHTSCGLVSFGNHLIIRGNVFARCDNEDLLVKSGGIPGPGGVNLQNLTIEDNFFAAACSSCGVGPDAGLSFNVGGDGNGSPSQPYNGFMIRDNSFHDPVGFNPQNNTSFTGSDFTGNILPRTNGSTTGSTCANGLTSAYNLFVGGPGCGSNTMTTASYPYMSATDVISTLNYHLSGSSGSTAADNAVPTSVPGGCSSVDIDGTPRPAGNCDAGADQR